MMDIIEKVVDEDIRPLLMEHYGNIKIISFEDGILRFKLLGECSNCPSAKYTVEDVIEKRLKEKFPEINQVVMDNGVSDELLEMARNLLNHRN